MTDWSEEKHSVSSIAMIIDQLVRFLMLEPAHLGLSPRLGTGVRIFLDLFQDLTVLCF